MRKALSVLATLFLLVLIAVGLYLLWRFNVIPHRVYTGGDFGIAPYLSAFDRDGDGLDDQSDILAGARAYVATGPRYLSKWYASGYPDDGYGVCTDVVAFALLGAGYDLMALVNADIAAAPEAYPEAADGTIDFRRVRNLKVWFARNAIALTTDVYDIEQWQGGDIVIFPEHIGVVSDRRNRNGVTFLIHNGSPHQAGYEQDVLETISQPVIGHYRIS